MDAAFQVSETPRAREKATPGTWRRQTGIPCECESSSLRTHPSPPLSRGNARSGEQPLILRRRLAARRRSAPSRRGREPHIKHNLPCSAAHELCLRAMSNSAEKAAVRLTTRTLPAPRVHSREYAQIQIAKGR